MATSATVDRSSRGSFVRGLWFRQLNHYPDNRPRAAYLGIVVLTTIVLYYELYVAGAVGPSIMRHFGMSFMYFVYISVIGNAVGAFASLAAGLADRWGRANLVVYGLGVTGVLVMLLPHAGDKNTYNAIFAAVSFVEGIVLVATPALVRDFSPQVGRASAMGFWTLGPVVGSLVVAQVSSHTLANDAHNWANQFTYAGIAALIVFVLALAGLRELSPQLRDQLMVSMRDRVLIEARAKGIDVMEALAHPWRKVLKLDVVGSAFAISVFLLFYYAAVGFFVIYFASVFGMTQQKANSLGNWFWAFDAGALVLIGLISDKVRVRKPFMLVGALGTAAMTIVFLTRATHPDTSYGTFVIILSILAAFMGIAYAPWMASFTETVEKHNPALTATGLAVWGWILRIIVALSAAFLPVVVSAVTPIVNHGEKVQALATKYSDQLQTVAVLEKDAPQAFAALQKNQNDLAAAGTAIAAIAKAEGIPSDQATQKLVAVGQVPPADFAYLQAHGAEVQQASKDAPHQFQTWWWICVAGQLVFIPFIFTMAGRWSPKRAREDAEEHERLVQRELAALAEQSQGSPAPSAGD